MQGLVVVGLIFEDTEHQYKNVSKSLECTI